jgi:hypothetical protein
LPTDSEADLFVQMERRIRTLERRLARGANRDWVFPTLILPWTNYDTNHTPVRYRFESADSVVIEGVGKSGLNGSICFMLEDAYKPVKIQQIKIRTTPADAAHSLINVHPNGEVRVHSEATGTNAVTAASFTGARYSTT